MDALQEKTLMQRKYPMPDIDRRETTLGSTPLTIEFPLGKNIHAIRITAPDYVMKGTCRIIKLDNHFGEISTVSMPVEIFNTFLYFPIEKSSFNFDGARIEIRFKMPQVFPEHERVFLWFICEPLVREIA